MMPLYIMASGLNKGSKLATKRLFPDSDERKYNRPIKKPSDTMLFPKPVPNNHIKGIYAVNTMSKNIFITGFSGLSIFHTRNT